MRPAWRSLLRRPRALLVIQDEGDRTRCARVEEVAASEDVRGVRVTALEHAPRLGHPDTAACLRRLARAGATPAAAAVLLTLDARFCGRTGPRPSFAPATLAAWRALLSEAGLASAGVQPLFGAPLHDLDLAELHAPLLCLQVERGVAALLEADAGGVREVELFELDSGGLTPRRALAHIGPGCEELCLAGSGTDLSALGYALARHARPWVRIVGLHGAALPTHVAGGRAEELAGVRGSARVVFALVPPLWTAGMRDPAPFPPRALPAPFRARNAAPDEGDPRLGPSTWHAS